MDLIGLNEPKGVYPASWYAATAPLLPGFPALAGTHRADVCVVGGGYTGLSAALHLAGRGYSVILLDAQRVGWGASGRNGGQLGSGQRIDQMRLEKMLGPDHAKRLWTIAVEAVALVKSLIGEHKIDAELKPGVLHVDHRARFVPATEAYVEHLRRAYDYRSIRFVARAELGQMLGTSAYFGGALDVSAGHLHPLKFALGLARAAIQKGVKIFERSRVTKVGKTDPATVTTGEGTVIARFVVLACNGYLGELEREVASRVMPINSYIVATEPLGEALARALIRDDVAVADSRFVVNYFRLTSDHRLLFGGRESYGYRYPADIASAVRRRMLAIYPQLADARIDYAWGGALGITMNRMPHLARLAPNVLSASGYSGHGLGMATIAGQLCAEAIAGVAGRFDVMADVPIARFPGGVALRRPLLVLAMLWFALRDRL